MARRNYFLFPERADQFDKALIELLQKISRGQRARFGSPENEMRYYHGLKFVSASSSNPEEEWEMEEHSSEIKIAIKDIRDHNIFALITFIQDFVKQADHSMGRMVYEKVTEACEKVGNVVNAKEFESKADAFFDALKGLEFGLDREGKISLPSLHLSPKAHAALSKDIESKGPEFKKKVDELTNDKINAAIKKEEQRIARFKT